MHVIHKVVSRSVDTFVLLLVLAWIYFMGIGNNTYKTVSRKCWYESDKLRWNFHATFSLGWCMDVWCTHYVVAYSGKTNIIYVGYSYAFWAYCWFVASNSYFEIKTKKMKHKAFSLNFLLHWANCNLRFLLYWSSAYENCLNTNILHMKIEISNATFNMYRSTIHTNLWYIFRVYLRQGSCNSQNNFCRC